MRRNDVALHGQPMQNSHVDLGIILLISPPYPRQGSLPSSSQASLEIIQIMSFAVTLLSSSEGEGP